MKSGKVWGDTFVIDSSDAVKICYMDIRPHMRCSLHLHPAVYNGFFVFSGRLWIEVHKTDYALVDVTELGPIESMMVKYGEKHVFVTKDEPCRAIEWYRGERANCGDIVRDNVGGSTST